MRAYSPGGALNALATALILNGPTPSAHRLQRGLPGYLILFAPHAFAPQRQLMARSSPSPPVFFLISTDFTPTRNSSSPSITLVTQFQRTSSVEPRYLTPDLHYTYTPFTPNKSEQRLPLTCYRGCWHVISRGLFPGSRHLQGITSLHYSPPGKGLYNLPAFFVHAASLRQGFPHCGRFLAAASRRSPGRVSVPVWPITLSGRLLIVALVGRYPTN